MVTPHTYNLADTPSVKKEYQNLTDEKKKELINEEIYSNDLDKVFKISSLGKDGHIYVELLEELGADKRGTAILNLETILKNKIDEGLTIWCEPLGDKNALRKLRGITIKNEIGN